MIDKAEARRGVAVACSSKSHAASCRFHPCQGMIRAYWSMQLDVQMAVHWACTVEVGRAGAVDPALSISGGTGRSMGLLRNAGKAHAGTRPSS